VHTHASPPSRSATAPSGRAREAPDARVQQARRVRRGSLAVITLSRLCPVDPGRRHDHMEIAKDFQQLPDHGLSPLSVSKTLSWQPRIGVAHFHDQNLQTELRTNEKLSAIRNSVWCCVLPKLKEQLPNVLTLEKINTLGRVTQ
jgi:hypothetical protein